MNIENTAEAIMLQSKFYVDNLIDYSQYSKEAESILKQFEQSISARVFDEAEQAMLHSPPTWPFKSNNPYKKETSNQTEG